MSVRVVTDWASSLSSSDRERLFIETVPMHVHAEGRALTDSDLCSPGFYARLADMPELPTTSQPSPEECAEVFRRLLGQGHDVVAVLISAGMSGTVRSAELAAQTVRPEWPERRVQVVDSRSNSLEEGYAVLSAAEIAAAGGSTDECRTAAEETVRRTRFLFTPHTLDYLKRGGRISGASALMGVMLRIAPVLTANEGTTGVAGVARNGRAARARIAAMMRKDVARCGLRRAAVQYVADEEAAARFASEVVEPIAGRRVDLIPIHPVVGLHVGPAVGVVYETAEPLR